MMTLMKYAKKALSSVALAAILTGCAGTVTPKTVQSSQASWDAGQQTSGILNGETVNGKKGFHVTVHFRDRYNALIDTYGSKFQPPLTHDAGITHDEVGPNNVDGKDWPSDYHIDAEHMADFLKMNRWKKQGE